jgi:hypothetical protein
MKLQSPDHLRQQLGAWGDVCDLDLLVYCVCSDTDRAHAIERWGKRSGEVAV